MQAADFKIAFILDRPAYVYIDIYPQVDTQSSSLK